MRTFPTVDDLAVAAGWPVAQTVNGEITLQGRVLQLKSLSSGESAGYGATWVAERDTMLAAVGLGYADGLPRHLSGVGEMALLAGAGQQLAQVDAATVESVYAELIPSH